MYSNACQSETTVPVAAMGKYAHERRGIGPIGAAERERVLLTSWLAGFVGWGAGRDPC